MYWHFSKSLSTGRFLAEMFPMAVTLGVTTTSLVFSQSVGKRGKRLKEIG